MSLASGPSQNSPAHGNRRSRQAVYYGRSPTISPLRSPASDRIELLKGTLDLLVLRTLVFGPMHGHGIAKAIQSQSDDMLLVEHGSLYPALHRLVRQKWLAAEWQDTPKGRPMKFYRLTPAGRRQLAAEESNWQQLTRAIGLVLKRSELKSRP